MRKLFFFTCFLQAFSNVCFSQADSTLSEGAHIVFCLYTNDCVNCYLNYYQIKESIGNRSDVIFVVNEVEKSEANYFLNSKFGIDTTKNNIIISNKIYSTLNTNEVSSLIGLKEGKIIFSKPLREVVHSDIDQLKDLMNYHLKDFYSSDFSSWFKSSEDKIQVLNDSMVIVLNHIRNSLNLINLNSNKLVATINGNDSANLCFYYKSVDLKKAEIDFNLKLAFDKNSGISGMGYSNFRFNSIRIFDSLIFVNATLMVGSVEVKDGDSGLAYNQKYIYLTYSPQLTLKSILVLPDKIPNTKHYLWGEDFEIINETELYCSTSSLKDSLLAKITIEGNRVKKIESINVKYPNYFPLKSKTGIRMFYPIQLSNLKNGRLIYYFNRRMKLFDLATKDSISFPSEFISTSQSYILDVFNLGISDTICILLGNSSNEILLSYYSLDFKKEYCSDYLFTGNVLSYSKYENTLFLVTQDENLKYALHKILLK